jgi:multisubunit Na+/H+ antiporter MnhB subunit
VTEDEALTPDGSAAVVPIRPSTPRNRLAQWPIALVLAGVGVAMILIGLDYFRRGCVVLSASVLLAAFLRMLLPEADAGWLAVRSRKIDVIILGILGVGLTVFTFWVPPPS